MSPMTPLQEEFTNAGRSESCPVIDMHGHYGPWYGIYLPHAYAQGMLKEMDRAGVQLIVCSAHTSFQDPPRGNALMREVVQQYPDRFRAYWTVSPNYADGLEADLQAVVEQPEFVGVKLHPTWHNCRLEGKEYEPVFEWAEATGYPVLTHTWGNSPHCATVNVRKVAERYSQATILMGHSCYGEPEEAIALAKEYPHVYLELTSAYRINGYVEWMVREAGAEKVIFGSDLPWHTPQYGIGCVLWSHVSDKDRHAILHGNAERILADADTNCLPLSFGGAG